MEKEYICECGKKFTNIGSYGGHSGHCEAHLRFIGKYEEVREAYRKAAATGRAAHLTKLAERKQDSLLSWIAEQHTCERCGKMMTEKYGSGRFCSRACANTRMLSNETKAKISSSVSIDHKKSIGKPNAAQERYLINPKSCTVCGKLLPYDKRFRKTCSDECERVLLSAAGKTSASTSVKRSKNEIAFCELCESYFGKENVLHNEPMFSGWDADIIIPGHKIAILWNGPWHYRKITADHSLEQVQNRDRLKIAEITTYGFTPYVIKDLSKANKNKVLTEFNLLLKYLKLV